MALSFIPQQNDDPFASNRLKLAQAMMQQGSSTAPVGSHFEGLGRLAQALAGAYGVNKAKTEWEQQQAKDKASADSMFDVLTRGDAKPEELTAAWSNMSPRNRSVFGPTIINEKIGERKEAFKRTQDAQERTRMIKAMQDAIDLDDSIPAPQKAAYKRAAEVDPKGFAGKYGSAEFRQPKNYQFQQTAEGVFRVNPDGSRGERWGGTPSVATAQIRVDNANPPETWEPLDEQRKLALGLPVNQAWEVSSRGSTRAMRGQPSQAGATLRPADQARIYQESLAKATKYANENSTATTNEQLQSEIQALAETYYNNTVSRLSGQAGAAPAAPGGVPGAMPERGPMYASADGPNAEGTAPKPTGPAGERKVKGLNANQQRQAIQNIEAQVTTEANGMQFETPQAKAQWMRGEVERRSKEYALGPLPTATTLPDGGGPPTAGPGFKLREVPQAENNKMLDTINLLRVLKETRTQSEKNPGSTSPMKGVINALPGGDTLNNIFDPKGQLTRAGVANLGSALLQARSGLAVTQAEFDRIKAMLPKVGDPQDVVRNALNNIEKEMKAVLRTHYSAYGPKGGYKANQEIETMLGGNASAPPGPGAPPPPAAPAAPAAPPAAPTERPRAVNPQTGQTIEFDGTAWVPVP